MEKCKEGEAKFVIFPGVMIKFPWDLMRPLNITVLSRKNGNSSFACNELSGHKTYKSSSDLSWKEKKSIIAYLLWIVLISFYFKSFLN